MKHNIFTLSAIIAVSLAVTLSVNYFIFAWTPPDADPPGGTVPGLPTNPWEFNGTEIFYDTNNVGIGTNDPTTMLDVDGAIRFGRYTTAGRPVCNASTLGSMIFDTDEDGPYICIDNGGTPDWETVDSAPPVDCSNNGQINCMAVASYPAGEDRGAYNITPSASSQAIPAGYHNGSGNVAGDGDLIAGNIKNGVNIFGIDGSLAGGSIISASIFSDANGWCFGMGEARTKYENNQWYTRAVGYNSDGNFNDIRCDTGWVLGTSASCNFQALTCTRTVTATLIDETASRKRLRVRNNESGVYNFGKVRY